MKLVIQIPCYNEEAQLPETVAALPRSLPGIDTIEVLVVDDGSSDRTAEVAREVGATWLLRLPVHLGLGQAFSAGIDAALKLGADVIVNTDADHQYPGDEIVRLIEPIVAGRADMVIGDRAPHRSEHFGALKRALQGVGSWAVRRLSGTTIPDAASGFRAFSRHAALRMNVLTRFTYTLETIIQAGKKNIAITHVPIRTNPERRPSRLFGNLASYIGRSVVTMLRIYAMYEPLKVFGSVGFVAVTGGLVIGVRFLIDYLASGGAGHIQSLILAAVLLLAGFMTMLIGLVADLIASSRALVEDALLRVRQLELRLGNGPAVIHLESADPTSEDAAG